MEYFHLSGSVSPKLTLLFCISTTITPLRANIIISYLIKLMVKHNYNFQFIGGMKVGEPSADGRGSAPPELAEQQARAGSEAAPATPPL